MEGKDHEGFSAYQAATGKDRHSKYADPKFLNLETIDPRLKPASLPVTPDPDSGRTVSGNLDFAAEYQHVTALLENGEQAAFTLRTVPVQESVSPFADSGFYANVAQLSGHDSLAGYAGEVDFSLGYDFGRVVEVESGIPFYFLSAKNISTEPGASHLAYRYSSLGDAFMKVAINPLARLDYQSTLTVTAPTGTANVSTGQATLDWNNRVEHDWWYLHPFGEFVLGNVPFVTSDWRRLGFRAWPRKCIRETPLI